ncbi:endonuclease/exonuclease/phosphatase family protein [Hasllibacter sp. MH4015]|uniref:endonuclease/exonuclease/phosphatase family protein n=1 Tax=Hasllibacter sp. MH4015 TaxID=2854029 RepID=UPI001CD27C26|nr:endonuclease/exonuclease/phosphatase family protein [Hasllibacter sp. MH4015]
MLSGPAAAETFRIASYHLDLTGRGPGTVLRDILRGEDPVPALLEVIVAADADVLVLQDIDFDANGAALGALADALSGRGADYPHRLTLRPNTGWPTGVDLDGNGRSDEPRDAHGYGRFNGQGGMALLSRFPLGDVRNFSTFLWQDLPDSAAPGVTPEAALPILRLHSVGAWDVEVLGPDSAFHLLMSHATPPVFDGPEDRNGLRNADELRFWQLYLDGWTPEGPPFDGAHFAVTGTFNVDPERGEGLRPALRALLGHPLLLDPEPSGANGLATVDWDDPVPGDLRVDYVLPSRTFTLHGAGVLWPSDGPLVELVSAASAHRLVWVDVSF